MLRRPARQLRNDVLRALLGSALFPWAAYGQPVNDECLNAALLVNGQVMVVDNSMATTLPNDPVFECRYPSPAQGEHTIWFRFVAGHTSAVLSTASSGYPIQDTLLAVYVAPTSGDLCTNLQLLDCSDDGAGESTGLSELTVSGLAVGETYIVQVASYSVHSVGPISISLTCPAPPVPQGACRMADGSCSVTTASQCSQYDGYYEGDGTDCATGPCSAPPAHDLCTAALEIGALPFMVVDDNSCATSDTAGLCAPGDGFTRTLWYKVVGTGDILEATTCLGATGTETVMGIYCGPCHWPRCIAHNDTDTSCDVNLRMSTVQWCSAFGATYYIQVGTLGENPPGPIGLSIRSLGGCTEGEQCCPADVNRDGEVNDQDLVYFMAAYQAGEIDFNGDGQVDEQDFQDFMDAYQQGC
jgi:hypothetical protein